MTMLPTHLTAGFELLLRSTLQAGILASQYSAEMGAFTVVVDDDIDPANMDQVLWAMTTRMDPVRDVHLVENSPIDYLDFASPVAGLGGKMGMDATNKWPGETQREWGRPIAMSPEVKARVDALWPQLGL